MLSRWSIYMYRGISIDESSKLLSNHCITRLAFSTSVELNLEDAMMMDGWMRAMITVLDDV